MWCKLLDMPEDDGEVQRIVELLLKLVSIRKAPIGELEASMGVSRGTVNRLQHGYAPLKFEHILGILSFLQITPQKFFKLAYSGSSDGGDDAATAAASSLAAGEEVPAVLESAIVATLVKHGVMKQGPEPRARKAELVPGKPVE